MNFNRGEGTTNVVFPEAHFFPSSHTVEVDMTITAEKQPDSEEV